jgi:putative adhesin
MAQRRPGRLLIAALPAALAAALAALAPATARADEPRPGARPRATAIGALAPMPRNHADGDGVFERDAVELSPAKGVRITAVAIDNRLGDVRIEGHDGKGVVILAYKRATDDETLDRLKVSLIPEPDGPVRIATAIAPAGGELRAIPAGSVRIDIVIRAPRNARVDARVWNGVLELVDMDNGAELDANEGAIRVNNVSGGVIAHAAAADQRFASIFGELETQGIIGDVDLDSVRGDRLEASVHQGSITGRRLVARHVDLRTTDGDIRVSGEAVIGGHYRVASVHGDVEVTFAARGPLRVWARSRDGTVTTTGAISRVEQDGAVTAEWAGHDGDARRAMVELRSRLGNIRFTVGPE